MPDRVTIESSRFGKIEADARDVLQFPGLPGFPEAKRFVVRSHDRSDVFAWLVSLDVDGLAFVIANPWNFFPDYAPTVRERHLRAVDAKGPDDVEVVALVSVCGGETALNLAAPVLIHPSARRGLQVILEGDDYPVRAVLPATKEPTLAGAEAAAGPVRPAR